MAERISMDRALPWSLTVFLTIVVLAVVGLVLLIGGAVLANDHGSPYYLVAGIAVVLAAFGLAQQSPIAAPIYGLLLATTVVWSLREVGLDGWALAPRLVAPAVLGLVFLTPPVWRASGMVSRWWVGLPIVAVVAVVGAAFGFAGGTDTALKPAAVVQSADTQQGEWHSWGRSLAGQRYAPLSQINTGNVGQLKLAWEYTSNVPDFGGHGFEATPLAVDGRLYACLDRDVIVALDQDDGHELWRADPHSNLKDVYAAICRGVAYYEAPQPVSECQKRILFGTHDGRLMAVDAENGRTCSSFGNGGAVDLFAGMGDVPPGYVFPTSPPTIVNGVAIIGHWVTDGLEVDEPSGVVRGYDAVTGELRWAWDVGHPERTGLPPPGDSYTRATPNAWGEYSADKSLGLVYLPTGVGTPDYFGAQRTPDSEKYATSIVAVDAATGQTRWSFQTVHHDLWDYDVASQPVLVDLQGPDGKIPALIAPTKRGQIYVLDRRDGHPIDAVVEQPVPQDAVPEERLSPTQPYTTGFPSMAGPDLREVDMWGLTPLDQLWCRIAFKESRYDGKFTPPSLRPAIAYPGATGEINWGSVAVDPDRGLLVVNTLHMADRAHLIPRADADRMAAAGNARGSRYTYFFPQKGTPYAYVRSIFLSPLAAPCQRPPYGDISVFDIATRKLLWSKPLGTAEGSGPFGIASHLPIPIGAPDLGGSIATAGGVIFIGAAQDRRLHAYDIGNGKQLWTAALPTIAAATPMTYISKKSGRQFVVIAAGGHPSLDGPKGGHVMAFALPAGQ